MDIHPRADEVRAALKAKFGEFYLAALRINRNSGQLVTALRKPPGQVDPEVAIFVEMELGIRLNDLN